MFGRLHFLQDSLYFPVRTDEVRGPLGAHVFLPVHAFLGPHTVRFHDLLIRVAQEGKLKTMFFDEFLVAFNAIGADAEKFHFRLKFTPGIAQVTGLGRAPRGIVLWVKIQNYC